MSWASWAYALAALSVPLGMVAVTQALPPAEPVQGQWQTFCADDQGTRPCSNLNIGEHELTGYLHGLGFIYCHTEFGQGEAPLEVTADCFLAHDQRKQVQLTARMPSDMPEEFMVFQLSWRAPHDHLDWFTEAWVLERAEEGGHGH